MCYLFPAHDTYIVNIMLQCSNILSRKDNARPRGVIHFFSQRGMNATLQYIGRTYVKEKI